jgi:RNase H-fold protein (predicted Holliday junction resolvase)
MITGGDMEIEYVDENYTSVEAADRVDDFNKNSINDTLAAMIILERRAA